MQLEGPDFSNSLDLKKAGLMPRKLAWDVLMSVAAGAFAEIALERVLGEKKLKDVDRSLVKEISFGAIRYRYFLDCWLDQLGKVPALKQPPPLRWLLHLGLYQIFKMQKIPVSAAVNTSVELAKASNFAKLAPVVNGVLRSAQRKVSSGGSLPIPDSPSKLLAQEQSLPLWMAEKLLIWHDVTLAEKVAGSFNQVSPIDLRLNRLLVNNSKELMVAFKRNGLKITPIDGYPDAMEVASGSGNIRLWPGYGEGFWTVQDRAAQWVAPLLEPKPFERVLDACAAPGGKATHLAELMGNRGEIWAIDRSQNRLDRLVDNAERLGITCLNVLSADARILTKLKPSWIKNFEKILVDAPCSGLGTLSRNPDARWRMSLKKIEELVLLQYQILEGLLPLLAPGGRLVYATCTINPDENTNQIERFIKLHPDIKLVYQEQKVPQLNQNGDGFYAAVIERSL